MSTSAFETFLETDPRDVGCGEAMALLHVYVDLVDAGEDAAGRYPGVAAHLRRCGPCSQDFEDLLAIVAGSAGFSDGAAGSADGAAGFAGGLADH